VRDLNNWIK